MKNKKIMIIDDEPDVTAYLSAVLKSNGYESIALSDVSGAMDVIKEISPDLICLDIMMPKETGISFYTKLRKDDSYGNIPVIIISGIVESENFNFHSYVKDQSIPAPQCYLEKPIDVEKYINKIKQLVN
ncbi:MAG: response regulator [Ignavibacteria bacterium]|jgi:CheY-like chemotaxis protein